jgi:hypothetical protein
MNKIMIALGASAVLLVGSLPAVGAGAARSQTEPYDSPMGFAVTDAAQAHIFAEQTAYVSFTAGRRERSVTLTIADASGQTARGHIHLDVDGDGELDAIDDFCGTSPKLQVKPGVTIEVGVLGGTCPDGTPAVATHGEVVATFTR